MPQRLPIALTKTSKLHLLTLNLTEKIDLRRLEKKFPL